MVCLELWFAHYRRHQNHLEGLLNSDLWAHSWSVCFRKHAVGPEGLHFCNVPW